MRAELSVGHFYWSPSVSHVRRELNRLLARGMVSEIGAQSGKRAITLYETTDAGLDALRRWVQHFPGQDQVVIKHPVILKTWLARGEDPEHVIDTLDRHLEATRARLDEALWSRQRSRELGIIDDPDQRSPSPSSTTRSAACTPRSPTSRSCVTRSPRAQPEIRSGGCGGRRADPPSGAQGLSRPIGPRAYPPTIIRPPSTASSCPVMKPEPVPARNTSMGPTSRAGSPSAPPSGISIFICWSIRAPASGPRKSRKRSAPACLHRRRQSVDGDIVGGPGAGGRSASTPAPRPWSRRRRPRSGCP